MTKNFTGKHMFLILFAGFGVVMAVNFGMAALASRSFSGVVVENSYVASQQFNEWLDNAEQQEALGWEAKIGRDEAGRLMVETAGVPEGATVSAEIRRPLGAHETSELALASNGRGYFSSAKPIEGGRWIVRLLIAAGEDRYAVEEPLE